MQIEKGIPIPSKTGRPRKVPTELIDRMEPGDSLACVDRAASNSVCARMRTNGWTPIIRRAEGTTYRVWRG